MSTETRAPWQQGTGLACYADKVHLLPASAMVCLSSTSARPEGTLPPPFGGSILAPSRGQEQNRSRRGNHYYLG
eukprot:scaffold12899_cov79-Isochrysis_galbana.AAC.1